MHDDRSVQTKDPEDKLNQSFAGESNYSQTPISERETIQKIDPNNQGKTSLAEMFMQLNLLIAECVPHVDEVEWWHDCESISLLPTLSDLKELYKLAKDTQNIDEVDSDGYNMLFIASAINSEEIVNLLLENGANVRAITKGGETPLHVSASPNIIKALLEKGVDPKIKDVRGFYPMHHRNCDTDTSLLEIRALLLQHGASINDQDDEGNTVLHDSVSVDDRDIYTNNFKVLY
jgi:hypothetical protein